MATATITSETAASGYDTRISKESLSPFFENAEAMGCLASFSFECHVVLQEIEKSSDDFC